MTEHRWIRDKDAHSWSELGGQLFFVARRDNSADVANIAAVEVGDTLRWDDGAVAQVYEVVVDPYSHQKCVFATLEHVG